ncbi:MAG: hypothetical protein QF662_07400, partial [Phycisphaerae bacterium]|nr:hypothetical protein [Phycisphaerae bacterium]
MKTKRWAGVVGSFLSLLLVLLGAPHAAGADNYWQHDPATPGDWFDVVNWWLGMLPTSAMWTSTYITNGGEALITGNIAESFWLYLGYDAGESGAVVLSDSGGLLADQASIGRYGTGWFTQTGGTNTVERDLYLGRESGSSGTYELSGGELSVGDSETIGQHGT